LVGGYGNGSIVESGLRQGSSVLSGETEIGIGGGVMFSESQVSFGCVVVVELYSCGIARSTTVSREGEETTRITEGRILDGLATFSSNATVFYTTVIRDFKATGLPEGLVSAET
jgi:hypothetical protein